MHGTVDFLCGGGDIFFNECLLYLEDRGGNCITAPATASSWGYVFSNCTIDGFASTNGNYNLGRPWQNSPKSIYINTKMNVLPSAAGWTEMGVVPGLFAEYGSVTSTGTAVDVSMRKTSFTYSGVTTPVNPWLSAAQAATYTIDNVLGGTDAWQPRLYTDQAAVPVISLNGATISWADNNYTLCWAVFKDGVFEKFVTTNSYSIPVPACGCSITSVYTVRAANEMGGLSSSSNSVTFILSDVKSILSNTEITVSANRADKSVKVGFSLDQSASVGFTLYNVAGEKVYTSKTVTYEQGKQEAIFSTSMFKQGAYILKLKINDEYISKKLILF